MMKKPLIQLFVLALIAVKLIIGHPVEAVNGTQWQSASLPTQITSPFIGKWEWESDNGDQDFSVDIKRVGNNLVGDYCCVMQKGKKMDCSEEKNNVSFRVPIPGSNSFITTFKSSFSQTSGQVKISFDGKNLIWQVTKEPTGEYYCPKNARLLKYKGK
jgi:uncharacterized protein (DUF2249 family)